MAGMQPDYSRQMLLKEIGPAGQARLGSSRVLVVGAGGLGTPVLQYLAGAGVGCIGIVDADVLDASNLHRQPLYALADVGVPKVDLARAALARLNPAVRIETHAVRFGAGNAAALLDGYDLVVDCSDNFRTKFLINDAAVLARKPAVFASVYQYEGQVQVYKPAAAHACLRCLWPHATTDGIVGNCAEAGVLGPVPGALGAMEALLALKVLLDLPGQLDGTLLLMDLAQFTTVRLRAPRRPACVAPHCSLIHALPGEDPDLDLEIESLPAAARRGFEPIDIRNADELAHRPAAGRHIPMAALLADPGALGAGGRYLLVCASGRRSAAAARELRARGFTVASLAGGLQRLDAAARERAGPASA